MPRIMCLHVELLLFQNFTLHLCPMKKFAVIVAGGSGLRMGTTIPKQFLTIHNKSLVQYSIEAFMHAYTDMQVVLVIHNDFMEWAEQLQVKMDLNNNLTMVAGGQTRFHSVKNGLACITHPSIVFIHDAVRCLVSPQLIRNCFGQATIMGSAIPAVEAIDSLRMVEGDKHFPINRSNVRSVQTPQTFQSEIITKAFEQDYSEAFTDEATVVEASGQPVFLIEGEYNNLKITRPIDITIAEKLLQTMPT